MRVRKSPAACRITTREKENIYFREKESAYNELCWHLHFFHRLPGTGFRVQFLHRIIITGTFSHGYGFFIHSSGNFFRDCDPFRRSYEACGSARRVMEMFELYLKRATGKALHILREFHVDPDE